MAKRQESTVTVCMRMTAMEKKKLGREAKAAGMSLAAYLYAKTNAPQVTTVTPTVQAPAAPSVSLEAATVEASAVANAEN